MGCICSKKSDANGIKRKKKRVQAVSSIASSSANNDALTRREEGNGSRENSLLVSRTADIGSNSRLGHSGFSEFSETDICRSVFVPDFGYELRYSFISQRGYYPDDLNKGNQDSFCIHTSFGNDVNDNYFGVFDGHGDTGAECSRFVSRKLCENLLSDPDFKHDAVKAYLNAFTRTNSQLHEDSIDDSMSGTTAITVLIRGNTLYVANVGDSRAVIAERRGGKLVAVDLSKDQTPYRDDECERVKKCGARVMTMEQIEGNKDRNVKCWDKEDDDDGDPPRVWVPNAMFPGTAFTRSLGDRIAETVGVCAVPEVLVKQFTPDHPFLIIASDGVFEFLSSQKIVDIVAAYDDPQAACQAVVIESYQTWLQNENRTDDITVIVVQIRGLHDSGDTRNRNDFSTLGGVKHVMTSYDSSQEVFDFTESSRQDKATLMCPTYSHQKQQEESASNSRNEIDEPLHKIITS